MFFSSVLYAASPAILIVAFVLVVASVRILREYERAVVFTLGRFEKVKGPGLVLLIPVIQQMMRVELRRQVIEIPTQGVVSRDTVSIKVDAEPYFNVVNPERAIIQIQSNLPATNMLAHLRYDVEACSSEQPNEPTAPGTVTFVNSSRARHREFRLFLFGSVTIALFLTAPVQCVSAQSSFVQKQLARYPEGANSGLTDLDIRYLKDNGIPVPNGLSQMQRSGLHEVIRDPQLRNVADRNKKIVGYLTLAIAQRDRLVAARKLYETCAFDPLAAGCYKVFQYALTDTVDPAAATARATYEGYARYLQKPVGLLTDADRRFLKASQINLPAGLKSVQLSGLHNVINDARLKGNRAARTEAINGFIILAVEANLYCDFNRCVAATGLPTAK